MVDFIHSVLGEATDHFTQSEVSEVDNLNKTLDDAQASGGGGGMSRGFDDHVVLANTGAPGSGRLAGALAFSLGVRQAVLSPGGGGLTVRLPDNLWANPASAVVIVTDNLTPAESSASEAVRALAKTWQRLQEAQLECLATLVVLCFQTMKI